MRGPILKTYEEEEGSVEIGKDSARIAGSEQRRTQMVTKVVILIGILVLLILITCAASVVKLGFGLHNLR